MARDRRWGAEEQDVAQLLDRVRELRLTLAADLSAAAGALDAGAPDVAGDIVAADRIAVRALARPTASPRRRLSRRTRALLALPAIPLVGALAVTGAAALSAAGHSGAHHTVAAPSPARHPSVGATDAAAGDRTASLTLRHLERVITQPTPAATVVAVASHLHQQLSQIIAMSSHDPQRLGQVQRMLTVEQELLEQRAGAATADALAASRQLTQLLEQKAQPPLPVVALPVAPSPVTTTPPTARPNHHPAAHHGASSSPTQHPASPQPHAAHRHRHHRDAHHARRHVLAPLLDGSWLQSAL